MCIQKCFNHALNCITKIEHTLLKQDHWQWLCVDLFLTWKTVGTYPTREAETTNGLVTTWLKAICTLFLKLIYSLTSLITWIQLRAYSIHMIISGGNSRISLDRLIFVLQYNFSIYFILDKKSRSWETFRQTEIYDRFILKIFKNYE